MSQSTTAPSSAATAPSGASITQLMNADWRLENFEESKSRLVQLEKNSANERVENARKIANKEDEIAKLTKDTKRRLGTEGEYKKSIAKFAESITKSGNLRQLLKTIKLSIEYKDEPQDLQDYQAGRKTLGKDGKMRLSAGRTMWLMKPAQLLADSTKGRVKLTDDQLGELKAQCADGNGKRLTCVVMIAKDPAAARAARAAADHDDLQAENARLRAKFADADALRARIAALEQQQQQPNPCLP